MTQTSTNNPLETRPPDGATTKTQVAGKAIAGASKWGERAPAGTFETYRDMRTDPTIALARIVATAPILTGQWSVKAPDGADDQVAVIQTEVEKLWPGFITNAMFGLDYGFQAYEKVFYQRPDGKTGCKLKPLLPDITTALIDTATGDWAGLKNGDAQLGPEKCLWYAYDAEAGNPYGRSRHENIRENAWFPAKQVESKSQQYFTKVAGVVPVIEYPDGESLDESGSSKPNSDIAKTVLDNLSKCRGVAMPNVLVQYAQDLLRSGLDIDKLKAWHIEYLETQGNHGDEFTNKLRHYESQKMRGWLVPERSSTEAQTAGSRADSQTAEGIALIVADQVFMDIIRVLNEQLVDQLVAINFGPQAVGTIRLERSGLEPALKAFFREILKAALTAPGNIEMLLTMLDFDAMLDATGLPKNKNVVDPASLIGKVGNAAPQDVTVEKAASLLVGENGEDDQFPFAFNPNQPRDENGRWTSGGGSGLDNFKKVFDRSIKGSSGQIKAAQKASFGKAAEEAVRNIPAKHRELLNKDVKGISFHSTAQNLTSSLGKKYGLKVKEGQIVGGCFNPKDGTLHLNGRTKSQMTKSLYAHEFSHVIDKGHTHSGSDDWQAAWKSELSGGRLTKYASSKPSEGFAEFARFAWTGSKAQQASIQKKMPKCYAFFKSKGLV